MSAPTLSVLAPGKLVLLGEYAVLDGAPALAVAVDRGVRCEAWAGDQLSIQTPGSNNDFVGPALTAAGAVGRFRFTAWNPPEGVEEKVGLGSSAAATVCAVQAAFALRGEPSAPSRVFPIARRIHHDVQGSGSGIDVAASAYGGLIRYRPDRPAPIDEPVPDIVVVWSGESAKTGPRVERYRAWTERAAFVAESAALVEAFTEDPIASLRQARRLLEGMAEAAGIAYRTPALDRIADLAEAHGGAGKPSGAGGGDIAIALLPDPDARQAFLDACAAAGLSRVSVSTVPRR